MINTYSHVDRIFNPLIGTSINRWVIMLPGAGCTWAKDNGGCTMCGFSESTKKFSGGKLYPSFYYHFLVALAWAKEKKSHPDELWIYNGGSYLNEAEIPLNSQLNIIKWVSRKKSIKRVLIESRPEFVTINKIKILKDILGNKDLMIGIGLESQDDNIRLKRIKKGFEKLEYENAIKAAKKANAEILTYVFLKPIGVSEKEAIREASLTIKYAFESGSDVVALESAFIQEKTVMSKLYDKGHYKPPWLWSILEVISNNQERGPIYVGGFDDEPAPIAIPHNCNICSDDILAALQAYRESNNVHYLSDLDCNCKTKWQKEMHVNR